MLSLAPLAALVLLGIVRPASAGCLSQSQCQNLWVAAGGQCAADPTCLANAQAAYVACQHCTTVSSSTTTTRTGSTNTTTTRPSATTTTTLKPPTTTTTTLAPRSAATATGTWLSLVAPTVRLSHGTFDGKLQFVARSRHLLFEEVGQLLAIQAQNGALMIFVDGNGDPALFKATYEDPDTSILTAPDLTMKLFARTRKGDFALVLEQPYVPAASALWAKHSEDTLQAQGDLQAQIDTLTARLADLASKVAADALHAQGDLQAQIDTLTAQLADLASRVTAGGL